MNKDNFINKKKKPIEDSDYSNHYGYDEIGPEFSDIISDLKRSVDLLGEKFETVRSLIQELARRLDESKICKTNEIGRKIKEILIDKIKEGKISERWIEKCLADEYKREHSGKKNRTTSVSEKEELEDNKIMITADGISVNEEIDDNITDSDSTIKLSDNLSNHLKTDDLSENSTNEDGCSLCKPIHDENKELKEALKSISLQTADKLKPIKFKILKERQIEINEEFNKCKEEVIVECHGYDKIISIKADIFKENNPKQSNSSTYNNQYNNNDTSNDDYTY